MAGPLTPYGLQMMQLLMRGIPIAQQRLSQYMPNAIAGAARRGARVASAQKNAIMDKALPMGRAALPTAGALGYGVASRPRYDLAPGPQPDMSPLANAYGVGAARSQPDMSPLANAYGVGAARPMTVRGANQWANVNPEAGMDQMYAAEIAAANAAMADPEAGMDQMYADEIAQALKKPTTPTTRRVAAKGPTKAQQKIIDDAAKNYQSNSMPVLIQPQGPTKGGAAMQPSINWGDANDAADFFRADALRRQMPGLLGWGGE